MARINVGTEFKLRNRRRLRESDAEEISRKLIELLGVCEGFGNIVDLMDAPSYQVLLVGNKAMGIKFGERIFLTVRGVLRYKPTRKYVTVDMGAVPYICNGADVMSPGVVDVEKSIVAGEFVWVRDARNLRPLAVGEALLSADEMLRRERGKAIKTITYVGDALWKLDE